MKGQWKWTCPRPSLWQIQAGFKPVIFWSLVQRLNELCHSGHNSISRCLTLGEEIVLMSSQCTIMIKIYWVKNLAAWMVAILWNQGICYITMTKFHTFSKTFPWPKSVFPYYFFFKGGHFLWEGITKSGLGMRRQFCAPLNVACDFATHTLPPHIMVSQTDHLHTYRSKHFYNKQETYWTRMVVLSWEVLPGKLGVQSCDPPIIDC